MIIIATQLGQPARKVMKINSHTWEGTPLVVIMKVSE